MPKEKKGYYKVVTFNIILVKNYLNSFGFQCTNPSTWIAP